MIQRIPTRGWLGLLLIAVWWPLAWLQIRPLSDYYFFPLWLGYILTVDSVVQARTGTSLITRSGRRIIWLFLVSVPAWWLFEAINEVIQNWQYHAPESYSDWGYAWRASLAFSTVVPAVLITAELVRSFNLWPKRTLPALRLGGRGLLGAHLVGWLMLALVLLWPDYFFPLCWLALFFILDPVVIWLGGPSIYRYVEQGNWSPVFNLGIGTVICGFFWEMWNIFAMPKWSYSIPYAEWLHIFEMPLLGYGGYIPFGLEIYATWVFVVALFPRRQLPRPNVAN
jgi:hypothetical protein